MATQYSTAAHLIHSRLEMVRHRLEIDKNSYVANIATDYRKILDRASESVFAQHGVSSEYKDRFDACELLKNSMFPPLSKSTAQYFIPQYRPNETSDWINIFRFDENDKPVLSDPDERLTRPEAQGRLKSFMGRPGEFWISARFEETMIEKLESRSV